ncbi:MAG TPA: 3,4-dihydroxy-2-butanone-4-phosphate synthase [Kofleriaceae bacterium]|nr:3,4-dihydroxy-2-butanone-4-phosphate synthase [Kofleriaceae bacterium]
MSNHPIERVRAGIDEIRRGRMVILVDDEDRENEGDLVMAAEKVTPEAISFMAIHGRGLICLTLTEEQIERLKLPMMVRDNQAPLGTAFTVSVEARHGVTTGISARDRSTTIHTAIADDAGPGDLVSPGHVFPLKARPGGVLVRTGQTEGSVDLARLAGLRPAGVVCEIMRDDGEMARMPDLERFSAEHGIPILSVADLVSYRLQHEHIVERRSSGQIRPGFLGPGEPFVAHLYGTEVEETEYLALVRGDVAAAAAEGRPALVRVQAMCPIGDPLRTRPDLQLALEAIDRSGNGVFLHVFNKARTSLARAFERQVLDRPPHAEAGPAAGSAQTEALRDFGLGAQVLADVGCRKIRLLSNTDRKIVGIEGFGIEVVERVNLDDSAAAAAELPEARRLLKLPRGGRGSRDEGVQ